jgi:hypothetical protein
MMVLATAGCIRQLWFRKRWNVRGHGLARKKISNRPSRFERSIFRVLPHRCSASNSMKKLENHGATTKKPAKVCQGTICGV